MSSPNSPSASEDSSRTSITPKADRNQLTPRSKVKALLAAIDDESSSGHEISPGERKRKEADVSSVNCDATRPRDWDNGEEGGEEDSDEAPIISRGRLAARLYRPQNRISDSSTSEDENSYERIKHQLFPNATVAHQATLLDPRPTSKGNREKNGSASQSKPRLERVGSSTQSTPGSKRSAIRAAQVPEMDPDVEAYVGTDDGSDSDLPAEPQHNDKLKSLVARKRSEARARQAEKEQEAARRNGRSHGPLDRVPASVDPGLSGISEDSANDQVGEGKLTQQARPTRKASKKALLEMNRETQRMSRNMQLAHQAKTKKKITKESFFSRFNFQCHKPASLNSVQGQSSSTVASSAPPSDKEAYSANESPPTSPLRADDTLHEPPATNMVQVLPANKELINIEDIEAVLPDNLYLVDCLSPELPKGVENSILGSLNETQTQKNRIMKIKSASTPPGSRPSDRSLERALDSDSDLEIIPSRKPKQSLKIFDCLPARGISDDRSLQTLRALAHINSPDKRPSSSKPLLTMSEMQVSLQRKARKQAAEERAAKIQDLKDRGIIVQSAEERERDQAAIEDLVEKARQEAASIMQKEKDAARMEKLAGGKINTKELSSDEDEEFEGDDEDESDVDFSGSSDDEGSRLNDGIDLDGDDTESSDEDQSEKRSNSLHAEPSPNRMSPLESSDDKKEEGGQVRCECTEQDELEQRIDPNTGYENERRRRRTTRVIEDDEDDSTDAVGELPACSDPIVQRPFIPGLAFSNAQAMGMTQAFAATMADLTSQGELTSTDLEQDSLDLLGPMPEPNFPLYPLEDSQMMVLDTQIDPKQSEDEVNRTKQSSMEITIDFSQSQIGSMREDSQDPLAATQFSEIPDPTQDVGFEKSSPIRNRFVSVPPSTVDTVILSGTRNSPIIKKKGRLHRRTSLSISTLQMNNGATPLDKLQGSTASKNAFDLLKNGAERTLKEADMFDKKQSEARAMVEEQAQESEDEYAGLGGVSDDESAGEEDEEVQKMIDEGEVDVDERELAAFYANKERVNDEKAVEKLFKELNSGGLRRKRGAEFDLSDSDDDGEARRRAKRREFAKMRKALFENEKIGKIAEDPKKLAFLRAIENRENDENYDLFDEAESSSPTNLNDTQDDEAGNSPHSETNPTPALPTRQRPLQDSVPDKINRPGPRERRSRAFQKPSSLADIRASVSFLLEEPDSNPVQHQPTTSSPPSSDNEAPHRPHDPFTTLAPAQSTTVIDRLSLKRAEFASSATKTTAAGMSTSTSSRLAFFDRTRASAGIAASKVPPLLRRATTSNLLGSGSGSGAVAATERAAGAAGKADSAVRMGGSRKSSVGYFARGRDGGRKREEEIKEKRRREGLLRMGRGRGGLVALATGSFE